MPVLPSYRNQSIDLHNKWVNGLSEMQNSVRFLKSSLLLYTNYDVTCLTEDLKILLKFKIFNTETYSEPSRISQMELFAKIVNGFQPLTIFARSSILDVRLGFEYASAEANIFRNIDIWTRKIKKLAP